MNILQGIYFFYKFLNKKYSRLKILTFNFFSKFAFAEQNGTIIFPNYILGEKNIKIGSGSIISKSSILTVQEGMFQNPYIIIGKNTRLGENIHISACKGIKIGNNVLTGRYIYISDNSHGVFSKEDLKLPPDERKLSVKGPIVIEDNVWIGDNVVILSGVHIGKGAVIGANSVVNKDVPKYCLAAGVPAKILKTCASISI